VVKHFPEFESGMIYADIGDPNNFIEKMINIISDIELRKRLSDNAIRYIEENFLLDKQIDKLEDLLYNVVNK
jgi:glycosyltransferase involved in cell wall biosynthesis